MPFVVTSATGGIDKRYYVTDEMWATNPYNKFVYLQPGMYHMGFFLPTGRCSAQYVAPNLILSAGHCAKDPKAKAVNYKKEKFDLDLVYSMHSGTEAFGEKDWSVWLVKDPKYYSDTYFEPTKISQSTNFINAGWGWVRILTDDEINTILDVLHSEVGDAANVMNIEQIWNNLKTSLKQRGIAPILNDKNRLKASLCNSIEPKNCDQLINDTTTKRQECNEIFNKYKYCLENTDDINHCMDIKSNLDSCYAVMSAMLDKQNDCLVYKNSYPDIMEHSCVNWQGDSGGGCVSENGDIYGIASFIKGARGMQTFNHRSFFTSAWQFEPGITELREIYKMSNSATENIKKAKENRKNLQKLQTNNVNIDNIIDNIKLSYDDDDEYTAQQVSERIEMMRHEIEHGDMEIQTQITNIKKLNQDAKLQLLDDIIGYAVKIEALKELQQAYEQAKQREQSLPNRVLSAVSIGAAGIGGAMLMSGIAEQHIDNEAEQEMREYLKTMRCEYADEKSVRGGETNIKLPGGNDMSALYIQYATLANDLKLRKDALGMRSGIESEFAIYKSDTGLYDNVGAGIAGGGYASIARAIMNPDGADATALAEQRAKTESNLKTGAIVGGAGVVGGEIGNIAINGIVGQATTNHQ